MKPPTSRFDSPAPLAGFEDVLAGVSVGIVLQDHHGAITYANAAAERILGLSVEQMRGRDSIDPRWRAIHEDGSDFPGEEHPAMRTLRSGQALHDEVMGVHKPDGTLTWIAVDTALVAGRDGTPPSVVSTFRDISEARRGIAALENARQLMAEGERIANIGTWEYLADSQETVWSSGERRIYGIAPDEASPDYQRMIRERIHPEDAEALDRTFREALEKRGPYVMEHRVVWPDGTVREVRDIAHPRFDAAGRLVKYVGISRDVTDWNRLREQFLQAQKLESIGRLAGGVAHDFNNLLTVVFACCETLADRIGPAASDSRDDVDEIRKAALRARDLTGQLLAFARKRVVAPAVVDLNGVVRGAQKMLGRLLGEDIDLRTDLEPALWPTFVDPSQLEQVLLNLAVNARDAMPGGGTLRIETRNRIIDEAATGEGAETPAGRWVELRISDSGVGMSAEIRAHLFEPFFTTKEMGKGTGLGLATVYGIISQAGGHIHVESQPGHGATFVICLPKSERAAEEAQAQPGAARLRGTERILVVEDEDTVRTVVVRALTSAGYRVHAIAHPLDALALPDEELAATQLLVTDVVMPGIDGHDLALRLADRRPGLRVLHVSGYARDAVTLRGVQDFGHEFLEKPFTPSTLLAKVRSILDSPPPGSHSEQ